MLTNQGIILVLPHIDGNRTSIERFKSFIEAFNKNYDYVKIVTVNFPKSGDAFLGIDDNDTGFDSIARLYPNDVVLIHPSLNFIQAVFFKWANINNRKWVKPLIWLHQLIYGNDIFTPTQNFDIQNSILNAPEQGYVIACGGPFGIFSMADFISEHLGYKLVLDYRDPWTFGFAPMDGSAAIHKIKKSIKRGLEINLLKKAALITTVSKTLKSYFPIQLQNKIFVLPNGNTTQKLTPQINPHPLFFNLVYAGTLYDIQLQDDTFFNALKIFIQGKDTSKIKLLFIGSAANKQLPKKLKRYGLLNLSTITTRLNKQSLVNYMTNATCFLHLRYGNNSGVITSKQAEYLAYRKAILLPNTDNGDIAESILLHNAGMVCNSIQDNVLFLDTLWFKFLNQQSLTLDCQAQTISNRESIAHNFVKLIMRL